MVAKRSGRKPRRRFERMTKKVRRRIQRIVRTVIREKKLRVTVALVIRYKKTDMMLVIKSAHTEAGGNPGLVKGGVEINETVIEAAYREAQEEVGIARRHLKVVGYGGTGRVRSLRSKHGFTEKKYIILLVEYDGPIAVRINENEIYWAGWMRLDDAAQLFHQLQESRPSKAALLFRVLKMFALKVGLPKWQVSAEGPRIDR